MPEANTTTCRPILKWAGGKTQLLSDLMSKIPKKHGKYIEPFFGGGALFFSLAPNKAVIADSNPELVNLYKCVAEDVESVIKCLSTYENKEEVFYTARALEWTHLKPSEAAARTIFLNKTCFNGLYRVNKSGGFNVPYGKYKSIKFFDESNLILASRLLKNAEIICGDYKEVLRRFAEPGDVIFLDPPYLPVSEYSDFKRYTKEQFYEEDQVELAQEVDRLYELGCHVILTNSNHPLVHDLYGKYGIEVIQTKRYINCNGRKRTGEDIIVSIPPRFQFNKTFEITEFSEQVSKYPSTRYMGSKSKLLHQIWAVAKQFEFDHVIDLFSGSGIVGYMFKAQGKSVLSNDYMTMSSIFTKAMVENDSITLGKQDIKKILASHDYNDHFVENTFKGLYYSDEENRLIDLIRSNIKNIKNPHKRALAMSALIRTCLKKRPRGIFTYTGNRYDDGRRDLTVTFEELFIEAIEAVNNAVFSNGKEHKSRHGDAMSLQTKEKGLIYIDPPYYSPLSDNEYVRRYHFVEGLARDWQGVEIQENTLTKKFKSYPTPFSSRKGATEAFDHLFQHFKDNILLVSYSSNSQPSLDEMISLMNKYKRHVEVIPIDYKYSFGTHSSKVGDNRNVVQEYLFIGF